MDEIEKPEINILLNMTLTFCASTEKNNTEIQKEYSKSAVNLEINWQPEHFL